MDSKKKYNHLWISTKFATFYVKTKDDIIVDIAPIFYKFNGKHIYQLREFLKIKNSQVDEININVEDKD